MEKLKEKDRKDMIPLYNANCFMNRALYLHGSPEWVESRRGTVCASELGALLGVDSNRSRASVLREKLEGVRPEMTVLGERMCDLGKAYEPVALYETQSLFPLPLMDLGSLRCSDASMDIFEGRPDAVTIGSDGYWTPIEVKTRAYPDPLHSVPYESVYDVPMKHWVQLQSYMFLLDSSEGYLCSFSPRHGMKMFHQPYNDELIEKCVIPLVDQFRKGTLPKRVKSKEKALVVEALQKQLEKTSEKFFSL
jgi:hypothetical protein